MLDVDHTKRLRRARLALEGLSVGDALGEQCFHWEGFPADDVPPGPWAWTDDTEMALSIYLRLVEDGEIDQSLLIADFANRYMRDPRRGYGPMAKRILTAVYAGKHWQEAASDAFGGMGSMGNGSAMRVAPVGGYFADDIPKLIEQAGMSAEVTHAHPEGIVGAIAAALAGAFSWNHRGADGASLRADYFDFILSQTSDSKVREKIAQASRLAPGTDVQDAAALLGNGSHVTCPDTVPLCVWAGIEYFGDYRYAVSYTASAYGDIDTTCAIVGGIVALSAPDGAIPRGWISARGELPVPEI